MFPKQNKIRLSTRLGLVSILILSSVLLVVGAAKATIAPTVDTIDGDVDANFGSPLYDNSSCSKGVANINEIKYGWFQNNGDYFMMRIETCANSALSSGYLGVLMMDCDRNGQYDTPDDRHFTYNWSNDAVNTRDGTIIFSYNFPCISGPCSDGERVPSPDNNFLEWRIKYSDSPTGTGYAVPGMCRGEVNIAFGIFDGSGNLVDSSCTSGNLANCPAGAGAFGWKVPTVVEMKELKVSDRTYLTPLALGTVGLLLLVGLAGVSIYRRARKIV